MQNLNTEYKTSLGHELQSPLLGRFYKRNGYKGKIQPEDLCYWLERKGEIVAAARLLVDTSEATHFLLLRGLWVHKTMRGQKLGSQLLGTIHTYAEQANKNLYCLAFPHLENFYSVNSFKKIQTNMLPDKIKDMQQRYARRGVDTSPMGRIPHSPLYLARK